MNGFGSTVLTDLGAGGRACDHTGGAHLDQRLQRPAGQHPGRLANDILRGWSHPRTLRFGWSIVKNVSMSIPFNAPIRGTLFE
jgi:hypothetical protein